MGLDARSRRFYATVVVAAPVALLGAALVAPLDPWGWEGLLWAVALGAACVVFQVQSFTTVWRGQRLAVHPDEAVLLVACVMIPGQAVVGIAVLSSLVGQLWLRKPLVKAAFNVAAQAIAASGGVLAFALARDAGLAAVAAAFLVPPVVSLVNQSIVALFLTRLAGRPLSSAWNASLVGTVSVASLAGITVGVVALALYDFHPVALVLVMPVGYLAHRSVGWAAHAENELTTRRALNGFSTRLVANADPRALPALALEAAREAFAPLAAGVCVGEVEAGDPCPPPTPRSVLVEAPLAARDRSPLGRIWVVLGARSEAEAAASRALLELLATHVALAVARASAEQEAEAHREALARAERLASLGTLVGGVAHEVNNPLMYMQGNLDLLDMDIDDLAGATGPGGDMDEGPDIAAMRERIEAVRYGVGRIQRITKALAVVARAQGAPLGKRVDAADVFADVEALARPRVPAGVDLEFAPVGGLGLAGVRSDLGQALLALVQNGLDATAPGGGRVRVAARRTEEAVLITVEDEGVGMAEEARRRAFTPFFTTKPDGTGLGLAGVLSIVTAHGGTVRLDSREGEGTRVEVRLPPAPG